MRTRPALTPVLLVLALAGTSACASRVKQEDRAIEATAPATTEQSATAEATTEPTATATATASAAAVASSAATAASAGTPASSAATTAATAGTAKASAPPARPVSTSAPGTAAASKATRPGRYTYDTKGTVTLGTGAPQDSSGTSTLTVSPYKAGGQHTAQHREDTGDTDQQLLVRDRGTYLSQLKLTTPAFTKEFRPDPAVLLVPDPGKVGTKWTWGGVSTDGKTKVSTTNTIRREETLVIGGQRVPCVVLQTRIVLSGDVSYTADLTTWWAPSYRLPVKDHTVGKGKYNGFPFSTDSTSILRSVKPS